MPDCNVDVLIAGGSIAGVATAAALREFGLSVLIVEPGQRTERRLAGELIHPLGIAGLRDLGLFDAEAFADAAPIGGFAIFPEAGEAGCRVELAYGRQGSGASALAIDYPALRRHLDRAARRLDHVTLLDGARVTAIDMGDISAPRVLVERGGEKHTITCRLVVAADGASSPVRGLAGIGHTRRTISTISGYVIDNASLPSPGFGHVLIGGPSIVLAYEIGGGRVRVMFDQPIEQDEVSPALHRETLLASLPAPFRHQVANAMVRQKPLTYRSAEVLAHATSRGAVVLVGDAGGSCHPLTATGMTVGISDGLRLRDALRLHGGSIPDAVQHYDRVRRKAQRSRRLVAAALHDVCSRQEPESRALRAGLLRYWRKDARSRSSTMSILAMADDSVTSALWHFIKVAQHGLVDHWHRQGSGRLARLGISAKLFGAVGAMTIKHANASFRTR